MRPVVPWFVLALVWALVGVNALGVLTMLGKQFILPDDENQENDQREDNNEQQND